MPNSGGDKQTNKPLDGDPASKQPVTGPKPADETKVTVPDNKGPSTGRLQTDEEREDAVRRPGSPRDDVDGFSDNPEEDKTD